MAWNLMDSMNKKEPDIFDEIICIEGIPINRLLFVDDVVEISRTSESSDKNNVFHEVFQCENRIRYKANKCKILAMGKKENKWVVMNDEIMEEKPSHEYLGTIISKVGRKQEME